MREACHHARITPAVGFHILRHTWASLAVMAGMPLMVVARDLWSRRYHDGGEALRPLGRELHHQGNPQKRPALWRQGQQASGADLTSHHPALG